MTKSLVRTVNEGLPYIQLRKAENVGCRWFAPLVLPRPVHGSQFTKLRRCLVLPRAQRIFWDSTAQNTGRQALPSLQAYSRNELASQLAQLTQPNLPNPTCQLGSGTVPYTSGAVHQRRMVLTSTPSYLTTQPTPLPYWLFGLPFYLLTCLSLPAR